MIAKTLPLRKTCGHFPVPVEDDVQVRWLGLRLEQGDREGAAAKNGEGCPHVPRQ